MEVCCTPHRYVRLKRPKQSVRLRSFAVALGAQKRNHKFNKQARAHLSNLAQEQTSAVFFQAPAFN